MHNGVNICNTMWGVGKRMHTFPTKLLSYSRVLQFITLGLSLAILGFGVIAVRFSAMEIQAHNTFISSIVWWCGIPILQFNTEIRKHRSIFPYFALANKKTWFIRVN